MIIYLKGGATLKRVISILSGKTLDTELCTEMSEFSKFVN